MRKMRWVLLLAAMALLAASTAMAGPPYSLAPPSPGPDGVVVGNLLKLADSWGSTNGGEFVVTNTSRPLNVAFETFCVQVQEYLNFSNSFYVAGVTGVSVVAGGNPLNPKTAWVFSQFRAGTLAGYDYANTVSRVNDANDLQKLIWWYEGEAGGAIVGKGVAWNAAIPASWTGLGNVRVLNLKWDSATGADAQDVLTIVPEPVFFQMGALLGLGGMGLIRSRRRRA